MGFFLMAAVQGARRTDGYHRPARKPGTMLTMAALVATLTIVCLAMSPVAGATPVTSVARLSVNNQGLRIPGGSYSPHVSADGEVVAFSSAADLTGSGATTRSAYIRHSSTGSLTRIADGTVVGLSSDGRHLVVAGLNEPDFHVYDLLTGSAFEIAIPNYFGNTALGSEASLSANGRFLVYAAVTPDLENPNAGHRHIFVDDLAARTQAQIPDRNLNWQLPTISDNGRYVAFESGSGSKPVEVIDRSTGAIVFDPTGYRTGFDPPVISPDGTHVVFDAALTQFGAPPSHVFVGSIVTGLVTDLTPNEGEIALANGSWDETSRYVSFSATAPLLPSDINEKRDVYVYDTLSGELTLASTDGHEIQGDKDSGGPAANQGVNSTSTLTYDATSVVFQSFAANLVPDDGTGISEIEGTGKHGVPLYRPDIYETSLGLGEGDRRPPSVICAQADSAWHSDNVSVDCTAEDGGSGLANPMDTSFSLGTDVTTGEETANAVTGTREICDNAGNCTEAVPVGPLQIDRKPPSIMVSKPEENHIIPQGAETTVNYSCADGGSGLSSCEGSVPSGQPLDTSTQGQYTLSVEATDSVGNKTLRVTHYTVGPALEEGEPEFDVTSIARLSVNEQGSRVPGRSYSPYISANGEIVAFSSAADLTGSGATTLGAYVRHTSTGVLTRIADGTVIGLSSDGRRLAVIDPDELHFHIYDLQTGSVTEIVSAGFENAPLLYGASLSANGRFLTYGAAAPDPENPDAGHVHIFVYDLTAGTQVQVPYLDPELSSGWPTISDDGRFVAFQPATASHPVEVIDRSTGAIVFNPTGYSVNTDYIPRISPDGTHVLFGADPPSASFPTHVFVGSIATGVVTDLTPTESGLALPNGNWDATSRYVSFSTTAPLLPSDTNEKRDVYVYDTLSGGLTLASTDDHETQGDNDSGSFANGQDYYTTSALADDARSVVFQSFAANLVPDDGTGISEIEGTGRHGIPIYRSDIYEASLGPVEGDRRPPSIACSKADGKWHLNNVSIDCTAEDHGSGLANPTDASFSLVSDVATGEETANAVTGTREICDNAGNCTEAGPVGPIEIDRKPPTIAISQPEDGQTIAQGTNLAAKYSCADGGSSIASCEGSTPSGQPLDTSTQGQYTLSVEATDAVGNKTSQSIHYTVISPPQLGRCVKVEAEKVGAKKIYRGAFTNATCVKASEGHLGQYEWESGVLQAGFTTELKESTKLTLETVKDSKVTCVGETSTGEYAGVGTVRNLFLILTGCELTLGKSVKATCTSTGAAAGEIVSRRLEGSLGIETLGEISASNKIGLDLYPSGRIGSLMEFKCASTAITVRGSVIVSITENKMLATVTLKATAAKGVQAPERLIGLPMETLEESIGGAALEQAGLKMTVIQVNEEFVEIDTVT